ncbi:MAG: hypothetical protein ACTHMM_12335 [Agriterribacter sp.]
MNAFEDPIQFDVQKKIGDIEIAYSDLTEIVQGGPQVGMISINGRTIDSKLFGGPCLYDDEYCYVPILIKRFLGNGFKLAKINMKTFHIELIGKARDLIFLETIENNKIFFFEDLDKTSCQFYEI